MNNKITILDGGLGREIKQRLPSFDPVLWSASALVDAPEVITNIYSDYISAGSDIITTNNYTVVPSVLSSVNRLDELEHLTKQAGELANHSKTMANSPIQVAGCIPPLNSSYRPDLVLSENEGIPIYHRIKECLAPYVDLFLCESMSSIAEAKMAIQALQPTNIPIWVSFILDDSQPTQLLSKEPVESIAPSLSGYDIAAILFNCCHANSITQALPLLNYDGPFGGYANAFKRLPKDWNHCDGVLRESNTTMSPSQYTEYVQHWLDFGVTIVGGCCGIGIDHIEQIKRLISY